MLNMSPGGAPATPKGRTVEKKPKRSNEAHYRAEDERILKKFKPEEQAIITSRLSALSTLAYFIGKDFKMSVHLNAPGGGHHQDQSENLIKIDAKDLLEKPLEYMRCVFSHEAGHRRIDRMELFPDELKRKAGFWYMSRSVKEPRNNNAVAEYYPRYLEQMQSVYPELVGEFEKNRKEKLERDGFVPYAQEITTELERLGWEDLNGRPLAIDTTLSKNAQEAVQKTLPLAQDAWWRFPSKEEAEQGEEQILTYTSRAYQNFTEHMWPVFEPLVAEDLIDEKVSWILKEAALDPDVKQRIRIELEQYIPEIDSALLKAKEAGKPLNPRELSNETKKALADFLDKASKEMQEKFEKYFREILQALSILFGASSKEDQDILDQILRGAAAAGGSSHGSAEGEEDPTAEKDASGSEKTEPNESKEKRDGSSKQGGGSTDLSDLKKAFTYAAGSKNVYEQNLHEVLPVLDRLETDLRELFVKRRSHTWESGFKSGKKLDIKRRIQEKAKGITAFESRAWQKREAPGPKDYAISILNDLSGSMFGQNIIEDFKAKVVLTEALNTLSIKTEVLGFNDRIYEYQTFDQPLGDGIREKMGGMLQEVRTFSGGRASFNDDGWALRQTSDRLLKRPEAIRICIVLSDGAPAPSPDHSGPEYELKTVVTSLEKTPVKLIGVGIGDGTDHVEKYYPNSIANVTATELAEKLADLIRDVVENFEEY